MVSRCIRGPLSVSPGRVAGAGQPADQVRHRRPQRARNRRFGPALVLAGQAATQHQRAVHLPDYLPLLDRHEPGQGVGSSDGLDVDVQNGAVHADVLLEPGVGPRHRRCRRVRGDYIEELRADRVVGDRRRGDHHGDDQTESVHGQARILPAPLTCVFSRRSRRDVVRRPDRLGVHRDRASLRRPGCTPTSQRRTTSVRWPHALTCVRKIVQG